MTKKNMCVALLMILGLSGCGGGSGSETSAASSMDSGAPQTVVAGGNDEAKSEGWLDESADYDNPEEPAGEAEDSGAERTAASVRGNAKLILTADLMLETKTFESSCADIEAMTVSVGGYIESSGVYGETGNRRATYTIRVPQEQFEAVFKRVGETCHVVSSNRWSEDVTEQYTDTETRLATLETKHERLLVLLDKAAGLEDIISLENALADCEYEMDMLTGELRRYDSLVGFSAVNITINETQSLTAVSDEPGYMSQLRKAAQMGLDSFIGCVQGITLGIVMLWPLVIILCAVASGTVYVLRRRKKMKQNAGAASESEAVPEPDNVSESDDSPKS